MRRAELRHIGARWGTAPRWARALLELIPVRRDPPCNVVDTPDVPARSREPSSTAASIAARAANDQRSSIAAADIPAAHRERSPPLGPPAARPLAISGERDSGRAARGPRST